MRCKEFLSCPLGACAMMSLMLAGYASAAERPGTRTDRTSTRVLLASESDEGGIAGVTLLDQNFETGFMPGTGCMQNGWVGSCGAGTPPIGFVIVENTPPDPTFGSFSASFTTTGNPTGFILAMRSPTSATPETGRLDFDVRISATGAIAPFTVDTGPCTTAGCFINSRIEFAADGDIDVLQLTPGNCMTGAFVDSGADWTPGTTMRIGIEVDGAGVLRVYKDGTLIFTGTDIAFSCAATGPQGIGVLTVAVTNTPAGTTLVLDNISGPTGAPCPANIATGGASANAIDVDDLLAVITSWGPCPAPPAACPANIATGGASATAVDVDDLLAVITSWGPCP